MAANGDDDETWGNWQGQQARLETVGNWYCMLLCVHVAVRADLADLGRNSMFRLLGCILWMLITGVYDYV